MPAQFSGRAARVRAFGVAVSLAAALLLGGCMQDVCAGRQDDVVGCGGHWDQIYRSIQYPESPGG